MALPLLASLRRLASRAQWRAVRQLGSASADGDSEKTTEDLSDSRRASGAAAAAAVGSDGSPAAGADGRVRARTRSRDGQVLRTPPERESQGLAAGHGATAHRALAGPLGEEANLRALNMPPTAVSRAFNGLATPEQQALNLALLACDTPEAVLELVAANLPILHVSNSALALYVCSQLVREGAERWMVAATGLKNDSHFVQLLLATEARLIYMSPRLLGTALHACAKLGVELSDDFRKSFFDASAKKMRKFDPRGLATILHACAILDFVPPEGWLLQFYGISSSKLSKFTPQGLSLTIAACATLKSVPPASWLERFWEASGSQLADFHPQGYANVMHACALLRILPPHGWLRCYWDISGPKLCTFLPIDFSKVWNSCSWLTIHPPPDWLESFWTSSVATLETPKFDPFALITILRAFCHLGIMPPKDWLLQYWRSSDNKFSKFTPGQVSVTLDSCRLLDCEPPAHLVQRFFAESASRMDELSSKDAVRILNWCGHTSVVPPAAWLDRFVETGTQRLLGKSQPPRELCEILGACKRAGVDVPSGWKQHYHDASLPCLTFYTHEELGSALFGFDRSFPPSEDWLHQFWVASSSTLCDCTPQALSKTLNVCQNLHIKPPDDWLQCFWEASAPKMGSFAPSTFSNILYACYQLQICVPKEWLHAMWDKSAPMLREFKPKEMGHLVMACGELLVLPPEYFRLRLWRLSVDKMSEFIGLDFAQLLCGCGKLGIVPPPSWLEHFWRAMTSKMGICSPVELSTTLRAAGQLQVVPPAEWLDCFSDRCSETLDVLEQNAAASTILGLSWLGLWDLPVWPSLWERAWRLLPPDAAGWQVDDLLYARSLYHAYQAMALDRPGMLPALNPELFDAVEKTWCDFERVRRAASGTAGSYADVSACLNSMGIAHTHAQWCDRAKRLVMIVIQGEGGPMAVEVHLSSSLLQHDRRLRGSSLLRNRILAAHGWRVVDVDSRVWLHELQTQAEREEYLRKLLVR